MATVGTALLAATAAAWPPRAHVTIEKLCSRTANAAFLVTDASGCIQTSIQVVADTFQPPLECGSDAPLRIFSSVSQYDGCNDNLFVIGNGYTEPRDPALVRVSRDLSHWSLVGNTIVLNAVVGEDITAVIDVTIDADGPREFFHSHEVDNSTPGTTIITNTVGYTRAARGTGSLTLLDVTRLPPGFSEGLIPLGQSYDAGISTFTTEIITITYPTGHGP